MKETSEIILIDTNILVYFYTNTDPKKQEKAIKLLEKCWKREVTYAISLQNLAEFYAVITKKVPTPIQFYDAKKIIQDIISFSNWKKIQYDSEALLDAVSFQEKAHFWDVLIAATMLKNNIYKVYTENVTDFNKFPNITAINPF